MGLSIVTAPTAEPVTLAETKDHLRVVIAEDDGLIAGYILAARRFVEGQIHRAIVSRVYDYTIDYEWPYDECGMPRIVLPNPPLQAVVSVTYVDGNGATQTLAANQYTVLTDRTKGEIVPAYGVTWPTVRGVVNAITVRFAAGYTDLASPAVTGVGVPDELRTAIMLQAEIIYDRNPQQRDSLEAARDALMSPYAIPSL